MNTQIQEAANKWWMLKSTMEAAEIAFRIFPKENEWEGTIEQIVSIWIQEVVMEWWFDKRYVISSLTTDEELATIYLKEQESKEVSNVSVSVEEAATPMLADSLTEYIKDKHTQEECSGYIDGFKEAKEQDKELIRELLEVLQNMDGFYHNPIVRRRLRIEQNSDEMIIQDQAKSAITKANIYLNQ